jgi:phospholipid transport system transporter-binding protein
VISLNGAPVNIPSRLTIETAAALFKAKLLPVNDTPLVIDLGNIEVVDSAAVSLLLVWLREAQRDHIKLCFANTPKNLLSLARLYGVVDILPLCGNDHTQPINHLT